MQIPTTSLIIWTVTAVATCGVIFRPWRIPEYAWALGAAALLTVTGLLPLNTAMAAVAEGGDVYLFQGWHTAGVGSIGCGFGLVGAGAGHLHVGAVLQGFLDQAASPTVVNSPTWKYTSLLKPLKRVANTAPTIPQRH